ncbi:MAG: type II toxin-antitoxin system RelE/ParE family toxin [Subdoligranulum sp.]|nr:type II toxin-antitoxin system RelE/ParE family toxin [Subdoligranulum sp.]MBD5101210.1 type II toxin-antitoxin system RelE/ParE family toxin [Subdoligranulum sp.]
MKIVYTNTARRDLREIYEHIAYTLLAPNTAKALSEKLMQEIRLLKSLPERNPLYRDEPWHSQGVRFLRVKNYLVFYTVNLDTDTISVARIMYGGRDISRQLEETSEW